MDAISHYLIAEDLLADRGPDGLPSEKNVARATAHATMALVALTAMRGLRHDGALDPKAQTAWRTVL